MTGHMFKYEDLQKARVAAEKSWWRKAVRWWRRITGRDVYSIGIDVADSGSASCYCRCVMDTKTKEMTVLDFKIKQPTQGTR